MSIFDTMSEQEEVAFLRQILGNMQGWQAKTASATSSVPQKTPPKEAVLRLKDKLDDKGRWTGGTNSDGYPKVKIDGESELASHVLLKSLGRSLQPGQVVMHRDNDKLNLKPSNLRIGTQADNLKQMRDEGRDRPRGVHQEPDVKTAAFEFKGLVKKADSIDNQVMKGVEQSYRLAPGVTRYQNDALAKRMGISPLAAFQISNMQAAHQGIPLSHAIHNQAMQSGIKYPHHLGAAGRQPLSVLGDDVLEGLTKAPAPPPAAPPTAPPAAPAPVAPTVPRPRAGFTAPIQPSPAVAGLSAPRPATPLTAAGASLKSGIGGVLSAPRPRALASKLLAGAVKLADLKTELLPHQQRVVDRMQEPDRKGLVVIHGLGSGKTLTSIATQDALGTPASVVVPAALQENYRKEQAKHLKGSPKQTNLMTLQRVARDKAPPADPLLIVDEAHRLRDANSASFNALKGSKADKRLLLTGSPFYNHPSDIAALVNLAANKKVLPMDKDEFEGRYVGIKKVSPGFFAEHFRGIQPGEVPVLNERRAGELRGIFAQHTDYHPGSTDNFPKVDRRDVVVPLSDEQKKVYDTLMGQAPPWVAAKVRRGLPPSKQEAQSMGAFLTAPRQVVNSTAPYVADESKHESPKIQKAFENLQALMKDNPNAKAVVYSNFLDAGIAPYRKKLQEAGIPFGEFTGELGAKERDEMVRQYNEGKLKALLLSSAGGEGLDLKGTRLVQLLEPHWNAEKLKQVEGRAARYGSHSHLAPEEQQVLVERYLAGIEPGIAKRISNKIFGSKPDQTVDQYLAMMSKNKEDLNQQFKGLLPTHQEKTAAPRWMKAIRSGEIGEGEFQRIMDASQATLGDWGPRRSSERLLAHIRGQELEVPDVTAPAHLSDPTLPATYIRDYLPSRHTKLDTPSPAEAGLTNEQRAALLQANLKGFRGDLRLRIDPSKAFPGKRGIQLRTSLDSTARRLDEMDGKGWAGFVAKHDAPAKPRTLPEPAPALTPDPAEQANPWLRRGVLGAAAALPVAATGALLYEDRRRHEQEGRKKASLEEDMAEGPKLREPKIREEMPTYETPGPLRQKMLGLFGTALPVHASSAALPITQLAMGAPANAFNTASLALGQAMVSPITFSSVLNAPEQQEYEARARARKAVKIPRTRAELEETAERQGLAFAGKALGEGLKSIPTSMAASLPGAAMARLFGRLTPAEYLTSIAAQAPIQLAGGVARTLRDRDTARMAVNLLPKAEADAELADHRKLTRLKKQVLKLESKLSDEL